MPKMTVASAEQYAALLRAQGREVSATDIKRISDEYPFDEELKKELDKQKVEVWDKTSPINDVPAETVLAAHAMDLENANEVYLVMEGGRVMLFQPFNPEAPGQGGMTKAQAKDAGGKHIKRIADDRVTGRLTEYLRVNL